MNFEHIVRHARRYRDLMPADQRAQLATGQQPVALFITCSDSRVVPARITGSEPGELFELRTAGNVVPTYDPHSGSAEMGTIEYAVLTLRVPHIVVCGHSHCGAVIALQVAGRGMEELPALCSWLGTGERTVEETITDSAVRGESQQHLSEQLRELREYPFVDRRVRSGELRLHGWFYEIDTASVHEQDAETGEFLPL